MKIKKLFCVKKSRLILIIGYESVFIGSLPLLAKCFLRKKGMDPLVGRPELVGIFVVIKMDLLF